MERHYPELQPRVMELAEPFQEPIPAWGGQLVILQRHQTAKQYTVAEWEAQRDIIKRLYIDEGKPLTLVIQIMETEHSFRAT